MEACPSCDLIPFRREGGPGAVGLGWPGRGRGGASEVVQLVSAPGLGSTSSLRRAPCAPRAHLSAPAAGVSGWARLPRCPLGVTLWSRMTACRRPRQRAAIFRLDVFPLSASGTSISERSVTGLFAFLLSGLPSLRRAPASATSCLPLLRTFHWRALGTVVCSWGGRALEGPVQTPSCACQGGSRGRPGLLSEPSGGSVPGLTSPGLLPVGLGLAVVCGVTPPSAACATFIF